ncbi:MULTISPECIES: DMT family transporter [unclassified Aureimonas]|uniref:DMT family transporter n=1 Tax=unclassified Aureimonas TaxID=2615206 RepID=UPI0006FFEAF8|nr:MULTISPECIES: DMT family transporter [unclassified Aureimonas]KQT52123.1 permease [Aureimonas sp. Leaf427]KQT70643.1 permease [Aureimonas sp. Leaf460]
MTLPLARLPKAAIPISAAAALGLLVLGALAMGISPVFVRHSEVGPFASAFWRVALSLPVLALWSVMERPLPGAAPRSRPYGAVLLAGLFFTGDLIFWHLAIANTSIANATFFACLAPVWVAILSPITLGEKVSRNTLTGLAVCLLGAALLIFHSAGSDDSRLLGDLYGIATSFFFGLYFLAARRARGSFAAGTMTLLSTLVTTLGLFAAALLSGEAFFPGTVSGIVNLLALGIVSHAGGQGLLSIALGVLSASFSSLVIFVEAVAAALFAWAFAGERPDLVQVAGGILVLAGVYLARPRPEPAVEPAL